MPNMVDYLRSGWEVNLIAAIDFTFSNGHATNPSSLHYCGDPESEDIVQNPYSEALSTVGRVLSEYDSDKKYPIFGFGGIPKWQQTNEDYMPQVNHCFALNGNEKDAEIETME